MTQLNQAIKDYLESIISSTNLETQVFFQALRKGEISKHQFLKTQIEFMELMKIL